MSKNILMASGIWTNGRFIRPVPGMNGKEVIQRTILTKGGGSSKTPQHDIF